LGGKMNNLDKLKRLTVAESKHENLVNGGKTVGRILVRIVVMMVLRMVVRMVVMMYDAVYS